MSTEQIVWLFVAAVALHNLEEGVWLPGAALRSRWTPSPKSFRFSLIVLTAAIALVALAALAAGPGSFAAYLLAGVALAMLLNILAPHLLGTIALRRYLPGLATALLLIAPSGTLLLARWIEHGWIEMRVFLWAGPAVAVAMVAVIGLLFGLGALLFPLRGTEAAGWRG